jgi:hypothetical protein
MFAMARLARIIGLLALAAVLGACSAVKLGYNDLDEVAYWWLDNYIDLTDEQTPRVREDLARLHGWHRNEELPRISALLHRMETLAPGEISPAQACDFVPPLRERLHAIADRAEPAIVTLALGLAPEQLAHLERKYEKTRAQYRKEWVMPAPGELAEKRFEQFVERSEMVYGQLEEPQRAVLRRQLDQSIFDPRRLLTERQRRQQDTLQTLRKLAGQPVTISAARSLVHGWLQRLQASPDAGYRRYEQDWVAESCRTFSALHNSTTPTQREAAVRRLRAYQRDLRELSSQQ